MSRLDVMMCKDHNGNTSNTYHSPSPLRPINHNNTLNVATPHKLLGCSSSSRTRSVSAMPMYPASSPIPIKTTTNTPTTTTMMMSVPPRFVSGAGLYFDATDTIKKHIAEGNHTPTLQYHPAMSVLSPQPIGMENVSFQRAGSFNNNTSINNSVSSPTTATSSLSRLRQNGHHIFALDDDDLMFDMEM
eukprot:PhM_4_TR16526/c0_g1_i1/m.40427